MSSSPDETEGRETRIGEIIAAYIDDRQAGKDPSQQGILARHPEFENELQSFFKNDIGGPSPEIPETPLQFDHPPDGGTFGFVVHPEGITPPNAQSAKKVVWPRFGVETQMTTNVAARQYSLMVGSTLNPFSRPPWLPADDLASGFRGRWGNRVTHDPKARRAGMEFPEFWSLFLLAFRKSQSMA
jgi:hypothetical protein